MKWYEVQLFNQEKNFYFSYMEIANSSKEAKEKAKTKTKHKIVSARIIK